MKFPKLKPPKSDDEKIQLASSLYKEFTGIRDAKDRANWIEGHLLYHFDKFNLYDYLFGRSTTKKAFYAEIDIPQTTAQFKIALYEFYIVIHGFSLEELKDANTKKLHRALPFIRTWDKEKVREVIGWAERERQSLSDFLALVGAPNIDCDHSEKEKVETQKCKKCGKPIK